MVTLRTRPAIRKITFRRGSTKRQRLIRKETDILILFLPGLLVFLLGSVFVVLHIPQVSPDVVFVSHQSKRRSPVIPVASEVRLSAGTLGTESLGTLPPLGDYSRAPYYGELQLHFRQTINFARSIWDFDQELPAYRGTDRNHKFDITDDEFLLYKDYSKADEDEPKTECRYPKHMSFSAHVCNIFHQFDFFDAVRSGSAELIA